MKIKLLVLGLFFTLSAHVDAQEIIETVLFDEGFEDVNSWTEETAWIIYDLDLDSHLWELRGPTNQLVDLGFTGNVITSASWHEDSGPLTPDNLLVSPIVTLEKNDSELTYKVGAFDPVYFDEYYSVYAVVAAEFDATTATQNVAVIQEFLDAQTPLFSGLVTGTNATEISLSLNAFEEQEVRVIFRHHNSVDVYIMILDDVKVVTDRRLSVNKALSSKFTVFPNPTEGVVNFTNTGNILVSKVEVLDLNGRRVQTFTIDAFDSGEIDVSSLQAGVYFLNITSNEGLFTKKIIKK